MCSLLLPLEKNEVKKIKYFTARVSATPAKPHTAVHQDIYLRALKTLPEVEIHFGHFLTHEVSMPLAKVPAGETPRIATAYQVVGGNRWAWVRRTEEKGSDVNLATHLVFDACLNLFEVAVVISNDSDLLEPIKRIKTSLGKVVGILNPQDHPSAVLAKTCDFIKPIRPTALGNAQFAVTLTDAKGSFTKPPRW